MMSVWSGLNSIRLPSRSCSYALLITFPISIFPFFFSFSVLDERRRASLDQRIGSSIGYELRTDVYMETQLYAERCYNKPACEHGLDRFITIVFLKEGA
jgi:hypothetical protein